LTAERTLVHLLRHGAYAEIGQTLVGRTPGIFLNQEGREQAKVLAAALSGRALRALIATPLQRTQETAAPLAALLGLTVRIEEDLTDLDFGDWTMLPFGEIEKDSRWHDFNRFRSRAPIPGGESMIGVQRRAVKAILRLTAEFAGEEIAVFSHGDVIRTVIMHFLGMSLDRIHEIEILPGARCTLAVGSAAAAVLAINLPPNAPVQL
jgi:broad specificity phosphatase PhoE